MCVKLYIYLLRSPPILYNPLSDMNVLLTSDKLTDFVSAVNDACLVYDGRLVIDANFHTNDVSIRAAGPLTKFQRSYHADQWTHANFNSKEVGIQASAILNLTSRRHCHIVFTMFYIMSTRRFYLSFIQFKSLFSFCFD